MKRFSLRLFLIAVLCSQPSQARADSTWEFAVQVTASVQASPAQISLNWVQDSIGTPSSYTIYRKAPQDTSWGTGTVLPGSATNFIDTTVAAGTSYEYQIHKIASGYEGYGYVYAGINGPLVENRGKVLLLVDNTYATDLSFELARLQQDLVGDGWSVIRQEVSRNDSVTNIKNLIQGLFGADSNNVNCLFLFGHVPVPYSGDIHPDEHPGHKGAWPADVYYGTMSGTWTDSSVNDTGADDARNYNVPGDGKFDQSDIPATITLMVGRVDLANMPGNLSWNGPPTFPSELELLRQYLNKDHRFRSGLLQLPRRGLIYDGFGDADGYAYSASAWRNFVPFFGPENITYLSNAGTWLQTISANGYLWAYGCGVGEYNSIQGLGTTGAYDEATSTDLVQADPQAVFTMLFGSWLGDWDSQDDFQRALLAAPTYGLVCCWSGSPHWFCQHMALGETIGFSTRLTQNNGPEGLYRTQTNTYAGQVHVALMGDPTLRMHPVIPPSGLTGRTNAGGVQLNWSASTDNAVLGYHVYRSSDSNGPFTRLTIDLLNATNYSDTNASAQTYTYMVRAVKLEATPSGTYYNASEGSFIRLLGAPPSGRTPIAISSIGQSPVGIILNWSSISGAAYQVSFKTNLTDTNWYDFPSSITANSTSLSWTDTASRVVSQRFYRLFQND